MIIAISGARGFIGRQLTSFFIAKGFEVRSLPRINASASADEIALFLKGVDVVINLAGAPVIGRWSEAYKKVMLESRIITTRTIVDAIARLEKKPELLISASAVGIYNQDGEHTERQFRVADNYLSQICLAWEAEARKAAPLTRVAIIRLGVVLGKEGGALKRMIPLFKMGLGGKIASGKQGFPWIHIYDVVHAVQFIIENRRLSGEFNLTAPKIVDNNYFTKALARILRRKAFMPVPALALKIVFGEGAITLTGGQIVIPDNLLREGYHFCFPDLTAALEDIILS